MYFATTLIDGTWANKVITRAGPSDPALIGHRLDPDVSPGAPAERGRPTVAGRGSMGPSVEVASRSRVSP